MELQNRFFMRLFLISFCLLLPAHCVAQDKKVKKSIKKRKPTKKLKKTKKPVKKTVPKKKRSTKKTPVAKNQPKEAEFNFAMMSEQEIAAYIIENFGQLEGSVDNPQEADALKIKIDAALEELKQREKGAQEAFQMAHVAELEAKTAEEKVLAIQQQQEAQLIVVTIQQAFEAIKVAQEASNKAFLEWELKKSAEELAKIEGKT